MIPRVLVVDDEPSLLLTVTANLEIEGFEVVGVQSPGEALAAIAGQAIDLVLSDFRLPGMNGLELMREIRKLGSGVPVVLMTAFALESLVHEALDEGAFAILPKPFSVELLTGLLGRALARPAVLVVDDSPAMLGTLVESLRSRGIRAEAAEDAAQALRTVSRGDVDLCVVDMFMPGVSGPELIEHLLRFQPGMMILGISGREASEMVRQAGGNLWTFLRKPFHPAELAVAIGLARQRAAERDAAPPRPGPGGSIP